MAKKRKGQEYKVYYGAAGAAASTHIDANVVDVDPGLGSYDFIDRPDRGDGTTLPKQDEQPVKRNFAPTFSMEYKDGDTHMAALLVAAGDDDSEPVAKAFKFERYTGASAIGDYDYYIEYNSPGPLTEGTKVEFTLHRTSDEGR